MRSPVSERFRMRSMSGCDVIPQPRLLRRQEGGHQVPQPTCCYEISAVEFHVELAGVIKPNVEEDGRDVLIHVWRGRFFDDQGPNSPRATCS